MTNRLTALPDELYRHVYSFIKAEHTAEIPKAVELITTNNNRPPWYRHLNSDNVRSQYLNNKYRIISKTGKGRIRELDLWKLLCDLERPVIWHTCMLGWDEWFQRRYSFFAMETEQGITWHSIYEPSKLSLAGWHRLVTEHKTCYDTRAPIW